MPKHTAYQITPGTVAAECGSAVSFGAVARYVDGTEGPITTLRWTIESGGG